MKIPFTKKTKTAARVRLLLLLATALCALLASVPWLVSAQPQPTSIQIVNQSSRQIRHIYLSSVDQDSWGPDQLEDQTIQPGGSFTVSNVTCDGSEIKVIGEDENGCFVSTVVACGQASAWTISNNDAPNCGN